MTIKKPTIVLTRTENDMKALGSAYPNVVWIEFPLIKFDYLELSDEVKDEVNDNYDWLIFTSQNGVRSFFEQIESVIDLEGKKIACVGPKTSELVEDFGFSVDFIPSHHTSLVLAKELPSTSSESICYIGGNLSRYETLQILKEKAKHFMQLEVYHTVSETHEQSEWEELISKQPDIISFCSPSAVTSFSTQLNKFGLKIEPSSKFAAIGTTTEKAILDDLRATAIVGDRHTFQGMVEKIMESLPSQ